MLEKKKKNFGPSASVPQAESEGNVNVENKAPDKVYKSWDEWFNQYALKNDVDMKWKKSIKIHTEAVGCMKDQSKWDWAIKNFGL